MNEHPEINKPRPKPRKSKGELEILRDKRQIEAKERSCRRRERLPEIIDRTPKLDD
jgi:hypothetical protein